jgi:hypothetical protein
MTTALDGGEGSASRPGCSLLPEKTRYPLYRRLGGPQGGFGQVRKISPPTGIRSSDRPAPSQSLYQLRYPAHTISYTARFSEHKLLNACVVFPPPILSETFLILRCNEQYLMINIQCIGLHVKCLYYSH